jgi:phosphatidylglycerophosphatase A
MKPSMKFMLSRPQHMVSLSLGAGLSPHWPGTVGALVGIPLHFLLLPLGAVGQAIVLIALFAVGVWVCGATGTALGEPDHGAIVWDETWGMAAALALTPPGWFWIVVAFLLFRFFDIVKPWPINLVNDHLLNGFGVMFDDALAALATIAVLVLANWGWVAFA